MSSNFIAKKLNVLLLEKTNSHFECLFTQDRFLESSDFNRLIAVDNSLTKRVQNTFADLVGFDFQASSFFKQLKMIIELRKYIISNKIDIIIFNTAHNIFVGNLLLLLPKKILKLGILLRGQYVNSAERKKLLQNS